MTAWWHLVVAMGLLGVSGAYEGRALTRDTAWWAAPEPQWRSRLLPALMPPQSTYWGSPSAQYRQLDQPRPYDNHQQQQQQHRQAVFQPQQPFYPSQPQQPQYQPPQRARYLRDPQDDPYRNYNPRQPAPWSVQVGTSLSVRDDDARGAASRRFYVHSQQEQPRWP